MANTSQAKKRARQNDTESILMRAKKIKSLLSENENKD